MRPRVIIYIDGGICSQMMMYLHGQYYAENGLEVLYDIRWFEVCGRDQFGIMPRLFELKEMWPNIEFKTISRYHRKWYLLFYKVKRDAGDYLPNPKLLKHSIYLYEYWNMPEEARNRLFQKFYDIHAATSPTCLNCSDFENMAGVHIRRGDLANGDNPVYGGVTDGYFLRAIEYCNQNFHPKKYLLFSDEPDWVEKNIANRVKEPCEVMRGNKAWEDLWLLAQCSVIVASQGSFGRVAAQLNPHAILIQCDNEYANTNRKNTYFIK